MMESVCRDRSWQAVMEREGCPAEHLPAVPLAMGSRGTSGSVMNALSLAFQGGTSAPRPWQRRLGHESGVPHAQIWMKQSPEKVELCSFRCQ